MHRSSIFSFDTLRLRRINPTALAVMLACLLGVEGAARAFQAQSEINFRTKSFRMLHNMLLRNPTPSLVFIGDSRTARAVDTRTFDKNFGFAGDDGYSVSVSGNNLCTSALLEWAASRIRRPVLFAVGVTPAALYSSDMELEAERCLRQTYGNTPYQQSRTGTVLWLRSRLCILTNEFLLNWAKTMAGYSPDGLFWCLYDRGWEAYSPPSEEIRAERRKRALEQYTDYAAQTGGAAHQEARERRLENVIRRLRTRGCRFVFFTPPADPRLRVLEDRIGPGYEGLGRLARRMHIPMLDFGSIPGGAAFGRRCYDYSHLIRFDATAFSNTLAIRLSELLRDASSSPHSMATVPADEDTTPGPDGIASRPASPV